MISIDRVKALAKLARLELSEAEQLRMQRDLSQVLVYADQLQEVDLSDVPATAHAIPLTMTLREDDAVDAAPLSREDALACAPSSDGGHYVVPKVIDAEGGAA